MTAEDQMIDAEHFLHLLRNKSSREELRPNLTAFLGISRGIIDHLLEDYNVKFGLNVPLNEKLYVRTFEDAAKNQGNQLATGFINFYKSELETLEKKTPCCHFNVR